MKKRCKIVHHVVPESPESPFPTPPHISRLFSPLASLDILFAPESEHNYRNNGSMVAFSSLARILGECSTIHSFTPRLRVLCVCVCVRVRMCVCGFVVVVFGRGGE